MIIPRKITGTKNFHKEIYIEKWWHLFSIQKYWEHLALFSNLIMRGCTVLSYCLLIQFKIPIAFLFLAVYWSLTCKKGHFKVEFFYDHTLEWISFWTLETDLHKLFPTQGGRSGILQNVGLSRLPICRTCLRDPSSLVCNLSSRTYMPAASLMSEISPFWSMKLILVMSHLPRGGCSGNLLSLRAKRPTLRRCLMPESFSPLYLHGPWSQDSFGRRTGRYVGAWISSP